LSASISKARRARTLGWLWRRRRGDIFGERGEKNKGEKKADEPGRAGLLGLRHYRGGRGRCRSPVSDSLTGKWRPKGEPASKKTPGGKYVPKLNHPPKSGVNRPALPTLRGLRICSKVYGK